MLWVAVRYRFSKRSLALAGALWLSPYPPSFLWVCVWTSFIFRSCPLLFLTTILLSWLEQSWAGWSLFGWWWAGQEGSRFLSILPPAVSPVYPGGWTLIGGGRGVKHQACWEGMAVSWCGVCPVSQPCLWSTMARGATGRLTTFELWLLTQRKSPNCSLNSLANPLSVRLIHSLNF